LLVVNLYHLLNSFFTHLHDSITQYHPAQGLGLAHQSENISTTGNFIYF